MNRARTALHWTGRAAASFAAALAGALVYTAVAVGILAVITGFAYAARFGWELGK